MATTTTVRSPSPGMGESSKGGDRRTNSRTSSRPAPQSRGVAKTRSDESLDLMQVTRPPRSSSDGSTALGTMSSSMTNRQRIANLAAKVNDSAGSVNGTEDLKDGFSSKRERKRNAPRPVRRRRSTSPSAEIDDDSTIASTASKLSSRSTRESRTSGRSSSGRRGSSRSRSKSRHRSKSAKSRPRRRNPSSQTPSAGDAETELNLSSSFIPPISPVNNQSNGNPSIARSPNSGKSEASKLSLSEMELMAFLCPGESITPTNSERMTRSVPVVDLDQSGRSSGTPGRRVGGSSRRERTGSGSFRSSERTASNTISSNSTYKRPPRNARGVGRSQSASVGSSHARGTMDALLSPRQKLPRPAPRTKDAVDPSRVVRRAKSTDDMGDLNSYFSQTGAVGRRKKPGSSSKSVASVPTGNRRNSRKMSDYDPSKPSSSRSTESSTGTDAIESDNEEDESINESLEDVNDMKSHPSSTRSSNESDVDDASYSQQSLGTINMEAALQMHMSRTENLLFDVFPKHIAEALRSGRKVEPENHESVTIFFSDIVGFTQISSELDPMKISDLLDRLYNSFDALSHYHDVFKVETIGDAYMAVTNLTKTQPDHCKRIAEFAIDAIRVANQTLVDKEDPTKGFVNIRVGFHSGPVVSNVVGSRNPRFCLFGDTVNTASRMESNSLQNRIHCSDTSAALLKEQHPSLRLNPRGTIEVKGKGDMETFWVNEDAAVQSQREGTSRSIFKLLAKKRKNARRRGSHD